MEFSLFGRSVGFLNNWYSAQLAAAYYTWVTVTLVGTIQVAAGHFRRPELAWFRSATWCKVLGLVLWAGGLMAFYITQYRLLFAPGPASGEAALLFGLATLTAWALVRAVALVRAWARR
ncbi:MAG: hypothetical protein Q9O62_15290 [Ardenticatenia bacterium]|nr:hypothetical protein [Ardenticatenia bacterium]